MISACVRAFSLPSKELCLVGLLLLSRIAPCHAAAESVAYVGEPFGVGRVTVDVLRGEPVLPLSDDRFTLLEAAGRVNYPVMNSEPAKKFFRRLLSLEAPRKVTIYYLFTGDRPFDLSAFTPYEQGVRVKPLQDSNAHRRLLDEWWQQYNQHYQSLRKSGAYPPVVENFVIASLSRRLDLAIPESRGGLFNFGSKKDNALTGLFVGESQRLQIDRGMLTEVPPSQLEKKPLPTPIEWPNRNLMADGLDDVQLEPLASHVPAECFYVRFGNFTNYWWFRDLNKKWQGDLGNMILRRGIQRAAGERIQQQLSLRENAMAKIMGPKVIADAAIIGLDPHLGQGAAIGILCQAKNDFLLAADLTRQRHEALTKFEDAKEQKFEIDGHSVSLISNPGGQVRSYYVQHEGFHLVTTSRTLVERFIAASAGDRCLADLPSFRQARQQFPLERNDTVVAFVPEEFWRNIASPHYFVENLRRVRSSRQSHLIELARMAGQAEGKGGQTREELIALDLLPSGFGARVDGSELFDTDQGPIDSLRGAIGTFVPIADMIVEEVSREEADRYQQCKTKLQKELSQFPSVFAAVQRSGSEAGQAETFVVDLVALGSMRQLLGKAATWLGQPSEKKLPPIKGNVLSVEAVVEFPTPLTGGDASEHHLFGALRDYRAPLAIKQGSILPGAAPPELVRGYLGAWPKPGLLSWLTGAIDAEGPQPQPVGENMWQAKQDDFLLISFKPDVVRQVLPQLDMQPAERPGQLWIELQDLTGTQMAENVTALGYMRTRDTSAAGSRMMNSLANQLRVPRHECRAVAERLIDGRFVCPLGGEYQLYAPKRGLEVWASSALPEANRFLLTEVPEDFELPMLEWFRGLSGNLHLDGQALNVHLEIHMSEAALP